MGDITKGCPYRPASGAERGRVRGGGVQVAVPVRVWPARACGGLRWTVGRLGRGSSSGNEVDAWRHLDHQARAWQIVSPLAKRDCLGLFLRPALHKGWRTTLPQNTGDACATVTNDEPMQGV